MLILEKSYDYDKVQSVLPSICTSVYGYVFGADAEVKSAWNVVQRLENKFSLSCVLGASNTSCQALFMCAADNQNTGSSHPFGPDLEIRLDAMGEYINNVCGEFNDNAVCTNIFGILSQSPPSLSSDGQQYFPRAWGVQGSLYVNDYEFIIGFAAKKV